MRHRPLAAVVAVLALILVTSVLAVSASAHRSNNVRARAELLDVERDGGDLTVTYRVAAKERRASRITYVDCTLNIRVDGSFLTSIQLLIDVTHRRWRSERASATIGPDAPDGEVTLRLSHCHGRR